MLVLSSIGRGFYELQWNFCKTTFTWSSFIVCHNCCTMKYLSPITHTWYNHVCVKHWCKMRINIISPAYGFPVMCMLKWQDYLDLKTCPLPQSFEIFRTYTNISFTPYRPDLNTKFCALCPVLADDMVPFKDEDYADINISLTKQPHLHDPGFSNAYAILCSGCFTELSNYCYSWPGLCIFKFHLQSFLKWFHSNFTVYCHLCNLVDCLTPLHVPVATSLVV